MEKLNDTPVSEMAKMLDPMPMQDANTATGTFEIAPGITSEEMRAMFFDKDSLLEPHYRVWQLNSKGHRYYYRFNEAGEPEFYPSVTTILSQTLPMSPFLLKWITDKGLEEAERYKGERAAYGTYMHKAFEELIINRSYNLDNLKNDLCAYIEANRLPGDFIYYADDLKKDILAFAQFVKDYDVRPYAVEIALVHPRLGYAGLIDMPCSMLEKPGSDERINAIVDFKSGRKGFWEESEIQLHLYKMLWNENFPDKRIGRVFNFAPKDWRKKPTYTLKEQTDSPNAKKIPSLLVLSQIEDEKRDDVFTFVTGRVDLDGECDLSDNYISMTLAEVVKSRTEESAPEAGKGVTEDDLRQEEQEIPEKPQKRAKSGGKSKGKVSNAGKGKSTGNGLKKAKNEPKQSESVPKTRKSGPKAVKSEPKEANDLLNEEVEL